jgi:hypothetical protein
MYMLGPLAVFLIPGSVAVGIFHIIQFVLSSNDKEVDDKRDKEGVSPVTK